MEPVAVDVTRMNAYAIAYPEDFVESEKLEKDIQFTIDLLAEDIVIAEGIQRGLRNSNSGNMKMTFGLAEGALAHFHKNLARVT